MQSSGESGRIEKQHPNESLSRQLCSKGKAHERIRYATNEQRRVGCLARREEAPIRLPAHHCSCGMAGAGTSRCGTLCCQFPSLLYLCPEGMYQYCDM